MHEDVPNYGPLVTIDYSARGLPRFSCQDEAGQELSLTQFEEFTRPKMRQTLEQWGFQPYAELTPISDEL